VTTVVDASSVVAYLLGVGDGRERDAMLGEAHAPALLDVEVTQTFRGLLRASKLGKEEADAARADLSDLRVTRHQDAALLRRAWDHRGGCTIYDALYVALAEALDAALVTRDARLARAVGDLVDVRLVP
jgi:predicted nucleic acid-binding protein